MRESKFSADGCSVWRTEFDNLNDMVEYGSVKPEHQTGQWRSSRKPKSSYDNFYECESWGDAVRVATKDGWPEGEDKARKFTNALFNRVASQLEQPYYVYDVEGLDFDMGRVLTGEPEVWLDERPKFVEEAGRVIKVVYNVSASAGIDKSIMISRGATVAALVQLLEFAGRTVELIAREDSRSGRIRTEILVTIKRAGQPLNIPEVVFAVAHPDMLRRFCFAVQERGTREILEGLVDCGYGMPDSTPEKQRGDIFLDRMMYGEKEWLRPEVAEAWAINALKAQGVEVSK